MSIAGSLPILLLALGCSICFIGNVHARRNVAFPSQTYCPPRAESGRAKRGADVRVELPETSADSADDDETKKPEILKQMQLARNVDLVFVVDVTGSMGSYIRGVRDSINDIVTHLKNSSAEDSVRDLRLAFVGYRDFGEDEEDQFAILPFTRNATDFRDFVARTRAMGGAKTPEDVFGGLDESLKLKWGKSSRTKLIFHIADEPGHGCDLHTLNSDEFPDGDPMGRTAEGLFSRINKREIQYYFGKIRSDTDVMIEKFSEAYGSEIKSLDMEVSRSYPRPAPIVDSYPRVGIPDGERRIFGSSAGGAYGSLSSVSGFSGSRIHGGLRVGSSSSAAESTYTNVNYAVGDAIKNKLSGLLSRRK